EAIANCKAVADKVEGHLLDKPLDALDIAREQLEQVLGKDKPKSKQLTCRKLLLQSAPSAAYNFGNAWFKSLARVGCRGQSESRLTCCSICSPQSSVNASKQRVYSICYLSAQKVAGRGVGAFKLLV
ncbi:hypothetical protein, partial [Pseudomonas sp. JAI120]|uniref:hypothetical protein n=1 Tax=Pseudomonas sp. JAI120 TaxID=2723063 RepID=UPI0030DA8AD0